jgi:hypothetical protein
LTSQKKTNDMTTDRLNNELESLKRNEQIDNWSVTLGYGTSEYTVDLTRNNKLDVKLLAKRLAKEYGAKEFSRYVDGSTVAVKFVVDL